MDKIKRKKTNEDEEKMVLILMILTLLFPARLSLRSEVRSACPLWAFSLFLCCCNREDHTFSIFVQEVEIIACQFQ